MGVGKASSGDMEGKKAAKKDTVVKDTAFRRFMSGPYFKTIPKQYEVVAGRLNLKEDAQAEDPAVAKGPADTNAKEAAKDAPVEDYLGRLKRIVLNPVDVDGVYGLTQEELVPLPFDAPKWYAYVLDVLLGVYQVAQATIVMFIAIYVENQERAWKSGPAYTSHWQPLVKALITLYPCFTLLVLVSLSVEYTMRKFMYFRLLSMRILVDWKNVEPWQTAFFYYFIGTWAMMNAWAIWGIAEYYNKFGNTGVDPTSFGTFVVVNLQTVQLLIYFTKLLSTEKRLVSLNCIFERAPVEAQSLLTYTYVVEEQDVIDECYQFQRASSRAFWKRMINCITCCMAAEDWFEVKDHARFDIERLKRKAANYQQVEEFTADLREEAVREQQEQQGGATNGNRPSKTTSGKVRRDSGSSHEGDKPKDEHRPEKQGPNDIALTVMGGEGAAGAPAVTAPDAPSPTPGGVTTGQGRSCLGGWTPMRWLYQRYYASTHTWHVGLMVRFYSWPFRPDVPYFRMLMIVEILGWVAVGVIVVLGWLLSAQNSNCTKAAKTCNTCYTVHERYFASAEPLCTAMETAVSAIVASANGTWLQNGRLEERYCNFACYGNFTPNGNAACPATGIAP